MGSFLIAETVQLFLTPRLPPLPDQDVSMRFKHILVLPRHKFCVWASSIFFLTRWIWPRADKRKKEADGTFVLLSAIRTHCSFYIFEYTRSPNLTKFRSFLPWKLPCIIFFRLQFGEKLLVRKSWAERTCPVCKEEGARSSVKEVKYGLWRGDWTRFNLEGENNWLHGYLSWATQTQNLI